MSIKLPSLGALIVALAALPVHASCGSTSCPIELPALQTLSRFTLDLSFQSIDQNQPRIGTTEAAIGGITSDHNEIQTVNHLTTLQFSYRPSTKFELAIAAPYVARSHTHFDTASNEIERWKFSGFGDAVVQARTRLFIGESAAHPSLWLTTGVKLPTGSRHEISANGEDAEVTITPGTGSTDAIVGLTYRSGSIRDTSLGGAYGHSTLIPYFFCATRRVNGRGRENYRRGNEIQFNAGSEYPLGHSIDLLGQMNGRWLSKDDPGHTDEDRNLTGGRYLFLSPGVSVLLGHGASAYAFVQIPLYQYVNGLQLTARTNYIVGVRQQF